MRIISGQFKGRRLQAPKGKLTRPTPDRVREALFSILGHRVQQAKVLDLFAGTGCLGLECLSRGADHATFIEKDRRAFEHLQKNVQIADSEQLSCLNTTAQKALGLLKKKGSLFDLVFLDPPYNQGLLDPTLNQLLRLKLVKQRGIIVCEHHAKTAPPIPAGPWTLGANRTFGDVEISFFEYRSTE